MKRIHVGAPVSLALVLLAGCGGGGSHSSDIAADNAYKGTYSGPFTQSTEGDPGASSDYSPPSSGTATGTVDENGTLDIVVATGYRLVGTISDTGVVSNAYLYYPDPEMGTGYNFRANATISFARTGALVNLTATVKLNGNAATSTYKGTLTQTSE